eukprot:CAMPEP_0202960456 /NCGR_PEP_ID=MMETSP1396-20130829/4601_1 /ASSEMBLY_ACC=CAM_ASM_000872 /TAXON_ID= /ORGANISM="Pseudokeronopsis sp., Strain Brazil" /LENGTH=86 /DNA_ID=CAMNT_0049679687 /DNA_START=624 /DNA_END=884 /DNA_ORIENTATION=+
MQASELWNATVWRFGKGFMLMGITSFIALTAFLVLNIYKCIKKCRNKDEGGRSGKRERQKGEQLEVEMEERPPKAEEENKEKEDRL